jgi:hypothetical protein
LTSQIDQSSGWTGKTENTKALIFINSYFFFLFMRTIHTPFGSVPLPAHSPLLEALARGEYDGIGFDLDHTLLRYRLPALLEHIYKSQVRFLVEQENFPAALAEVPWAEVSRFAGKGIVLDIDTGHLLKINANGDVTRCYGGMGDEVSPEQYGKIAATHL